MGERARADFTLERESWLYSFDGFSSPIDMGGVVNTAKAGQTIPVKWHLSNKDGDVTSTASFVALMSYKIDCDALTGNPESAVEEVSAGNSGLLNLGNGNWQYNWKTDKNYAKTSPCRNMVVKFSDNQKSPEAVFKFK